MAVAVKPRHVTEQTQGRSLGTEALQQPKAAADTVCNASKAKRAGVLGLRLTFGMLFVTINIAATGTQSSLATTGGRRIHARHLIYVHACRFATPRCLPPPASTSVSPCSTTPPGARGARAKGTHSDVDVMATSKTEHLTSSTYKRSRHLAQGLQTLTPACLLGSWTLVSAQ